MAQSKPYTPGIDGSDQDALRPEPAIIRAMKAARIVRDLLREDGHTHREMTAALTEGLTTGPLVIH